MFTLTPARSLLDELFREFEPSAPTPASFRPSVDVLQVEDGFQLRAELPGVSKESVQVELKDQTLSIAGEKVAPSVSTPGYRYSEIHYGKFQRRFHLAESIDRDRLEAKFENGVLDIRLYLRPEHGPRQIQVA
ncbi:MAG: Hsp20/alpha crystallin family protein [Fibrobacterota bacterium]|nr:MAG: Hsp20/alpha crystallin family protein [Fibrobacterota bacterium]